MCEFLLQIRKSFALCRLADTKAWSAAGGVPATGFVGGAFLSDRQHHLSQASVSEQILDAVFVPLQYQYS